MQHDTKNTKINSSVRNEKHVSSFCVYDVSEESTGVSGNLTAGPPP